MAAIITIKIRSGTAATWTSQNPTLTANEPGYESDTGKLKIGDGSTAWTSLAYFTPPPASHVHSASDITSGVLADGRVQESNVVQYQAQIEVGGGQITHGTIDIARLADGSVTLAKQADLAASRIVGRASGAGTGVPTSLTASQVKAILALAASEITYSNSTSGLTATDVQAALDEIDAAIDALISGAPEITALDLSGASTASFPSGANKGDQYIIANAHANGTVLGSSNQITVDTDDILLCLQDSASTTNGAHWHKKDNTDKVVSVAGRTGSIVLATADIASGTFADGRIAASNVTQHQAALSIAWGQLTSVPATFAPSAHTLDSHSNVSITSNTSGEILKWNGSAWINNTLAEAGISAVGHSHAAADITSGTFANGRIAASNVTQHQAALSIAGSQITGTIDGGTP